MEKKIFLRHPVPVFAARALRVDEDGEVVVIMTGDSEGALRVWDLKTRRPRAENTKAHLGLFGVLHIEHFRGSQFLSQGRDGFVHCWDAKSGLEAPVWSIETRSQGFCKFSVVSDEHVAVLACPDDDETFINVWDLKSRNIMKKIDIEQLKGAPSEKFGLCMCLKLVENHLFALFENGKLGIFDFEREKWLLGMTNQLLSDVPIACSIVSVSHNKFQGLTAGAAKMICAFQIDLDKQKVKAKAQIPVTPKEMQSSAEENRGVSAIEISIELQRAFVACWDGSIRIFDWNTLECKEILALHQKSIQSLSCSKDMLVSAAGDRNVVIMNA